MSRPWTASICCYCRRRGAQRSGVCIRLFGQTVLSIQQQGQLLCLVTCWCLGWTAGLEHSGSDGSVQANTSLLMFWGENQWHHHLGITTATGGRSMDPKATVIPLSFVHKTTPTSTCREVVTTTTTWTHSGATAFNSRSRACSGRRLHAR